MQRFLRFELLLCLLSTVSSFAADNVSAKGTVPILNSPLQPAPSGTSAPTKNLLIYEKMTALWKLTPGMAIHIGYEYTLRGQKYHVVGIDTFHLSPSDKIVLLSRKVPATAPEPKPQFHKLLPISFVGKNAVLSASGQEDVVYSEGATFDSPVWELKNWYKLPETQDLEIEERGNKRYTIQLKDFTEDTERFVEKISVWSKDTPKKLIAKYERLKKWDTKQSLLFNMTPESSNVYTFKLGTGDKTHEIKVYAPKAKLADQDPKDLAKIKTLIEKTPTVLLGYIERIHFDPGQNGAGLAASTTPMINGKPMRQLTFYLKEDEPEISVVSDILARPHVEETYWHELGHDLQEKVPTLLPGFDWTMWEDAIVKDQNWVTPYAMTMTSEDFPETLACYIRTDAGRNDPKSRRNYFNRFEILDRIFNVISQ